MNWWDFPVTQEHGANGEQGVDFGTPIDTPITSLFAGVVQSASYGPWGGLVTVAIPDAGGNGPLTEYALHLDSINVKPGDPIQPGDVLGLSGGQLSGGQHPSQQPYSSGPHLEYGFFHGAAFASASVDPGPIIDAAKGSQPAAQLTGYSIGVAGPGSSPGSKGPVIGPDTPGSPGAGIDKGIASLGTGIAGLPASIGHGLADAAGIGVHDANVFLHRQVIALFVAALVLIVLFKL